MRRAAFPADAFGSKQCLQVIVFKNVSRCFDKHWQTLEFAKILQPLSSLVFKFVNLKRLSNVIQFSHTYQALPKDWQTIDKIGTHLAHLIESGNVWHILINTMNYEKHWLDQSKNRLRYSRQ